MSKPHDITAAHILPHETYAAERGDRRRQMRPIKALRRIPVGPDVTLYFESFETMLYQVQEMLHVERGGDEQLDDELLAYNPLVPKGRNLSASMMIEIDDQTRRSKTLLQLGGIEEAVSLQFAGETVQASYELDVDRTAPDGKTSSVHFLTFPMTDAQAQLFKDAGTKVIAAIEHEHYGHMAVMGEESRAELAQDLT